MANGSSLGITLDGCTRCFTQASSDHCTAIRVEKAVGVALWGEVEMEEVGKHTFSEGLYLEWPVRLWLSQVKSKLEMRRVGCCN